MKNLYASFAALLVAGGMMAQAPTAVVPNHPFRQPAPARVKHAANAAVARNSAQNPSTQSTAHYRLSHTDAAVDLIDPGNAGGTFNLVVDAVFCDSTVMAVYSNGSGNVFTMKAGGMFDPKSTNQFGSMALNSASTYSVDTVWVAGFYEIDTTTAGDTLQLEVIWGPNNATYWQGLTIQSANQSWELPDNTTSTAAGNQSFSTAPAANKMVMKHVLTALDTTSDPNLNPNWPYVPFVPLTPINVPANNIVGIEYTYIPGSTYTPGEIYFSSDANQPAQMNSYRALLYEDVNAGTGDDFFYDASSYGTSGALETTSRYGLWPSAQNFLNGSMLPYTDDGYLWDVSITTGNVGIAEQNASTISLGQNIPNPSNGTTVVNYSIKDAGHVMMTVHDVTGKVVMTVDQGNQSAGSYQVNLNTNSLESGLYFYTLEVNGMQATQQMIVQ